MTSTSGSPERSAGERPASSDVVHERFMTYSAMDAMIQQLSGTFRRAETRTHPVRIGSRARVVVTVV
jgi:hypothetical protein